MKLFEALKINKGDVVSITGAGGKTSLMFNLAEELGKDNKVLVTTTTKIFVPTLEECDFLCTEAEKLKVCAAREDKGIYVLGEGIDPEGKLIALSAESLDEVCPYFDYVLIESDGSKRKPLKGWKESEPVVYNRTRKTVGVLDISTVGRVINEELVHRCEMFCRITGAQPGDMVNINHLVSLVLHPKGLFKDSVGSRIIFINKVEIPELKELSSMFVKRIVEESDEYILQIAVGSTLKRDYSIVFERTRDNA